MLTCVILASFAALVGVLTDRQLRRQFSDEVRSNSGQLARQMRLKWITNLESLNCNSQPVAYAGSGDPGTKVIFADGRELDFVDKTIDKTAP